MVRPHVLNALHELYKKVVVVLPARGERHPAVPEHHGGNPVPARRRQRGVPANLGIIVSMAVHPSWGDQLPGGFYFLRALHRTRLADEYNLAVLDGDC
jgi:hypothetical protein